MFVYYKIVSAVCGADKHFHASWNWDIFLSRFQLAAELQPARALLNTAAKSQQQKVAAGEPEDAYIVHLESKLKDIINFLMNNRTRIAPMPK